MPTGLHKDNRGKMPRLTVGYLTYITDRNKSKRMSDFRSSLESLEKITSENVEFLCIDNKSIQEARLAINESGRFSKKYLFDRNHFDIALFYVTAWHSIESKTDYMCLMYDDFIVYDDAFDDVIQFMDENRDVHCTRITEYDFSNKRKYNSDITSKNVNPDAIRHYNTSTGENLKWSDPIRVGSHTFYKNNWHYTSRPTVWRTEYFLEVLSNQGEIESNVLQGFEKWAMNEFNKSNLVTGVLDIGMVRTTPVDRSARSLEYSLEIEKNITISLEDLKNDYKRGKNDL